jgi:hypothetical protein
MEAAMSVQKIFTFSYRATDFQQLTANMLFLDSLSPLSKKQITCGKNPSNYIPQTYEHLRSKAREFKLLLKRGMSDLFPLSY